MGVCRKILYFYHFAENDNHFVFLWVFFVFLVFIHLNFGGFVCWPFFKREIEGMELGGWGMGLWRGERGETDQNIL